MTLKIQATKRIRVDLDGNVYYVALQNNRPIVIYRRSLYAPGTNYEALYNKAVWHHSRGIPKREDSLYRTILRMAGALPP